MKHRIPRPVIVLVLAAAVGAWGAAPGAARAAGSSDGSSWSGSDGGGPLAEGRSLVESGKWLEAVDKLELALGDDPRNADALNLLGFSYRKLGKFEEALVYYQRALDVEPQHRGANEYLGELYLQTDRLDKAEERLAVLDAACFFPCEEYKDLEAAIASYKKARGLQ